MASFPFHYFDFAARSIEECDAYTFMRCCAAYCKNRYPDTYLDAIRQMVTLLDSTLIQIPSSPPVRIDGNTSAPAVESGDNNTAPENPLPRPSTEDLNASYPNTSPPKANTRHGSRRPQTAMVKQSPYMPKSMVVYSNGSPRRPKSALTDLGVTCSSPSTTLFRSLATGGGSCDDNARRPEEAHVEVSLPPTVSRESLLSSLAILHNLYANEQVSAFVKKLLKDFLYADTGRFFHIDNNQQTLWFQETYHANKVSFNNTLGVLGKFSGSIEEVWNLSSSEAQSETHYAPEVDSHFAHDDNGGLLLILIQVSNVRIGMLQVARRAGGPFSPEEVRLAQEVSKHIGIRISANNNREKETLFTDKLIRRLYNVTEATSEENAIKQIFEMSLQSVHASHVMYYKVSPNRDHFIIYSSSNKAPSVVPIYPHSLVGEVFSTSLSMLVENCSTDPRLNRDVDAIDITVPLRDATLIPVISISEDPKVIGVILILNKKDAKRAKGDSTIEQQLKSKKRIFTYHDSLAMELIASSLAFWLYLNSYKEIANTVKNRAVCLENLCNSLNKDMDLWPLLRVMMLETSRIVNCDRVSVFLIDHFNKELWCKTINSDKEIRFPMHLGIAGHVATTSTVFNIDDAYNSPLFNRQFDKDLGYRTKSVLCVPIKDNNNSTMGVVQAINRLDGRPFDEDDTRWLNVLATQAAISMQNTMKHYELNQTKVLLSTQQNISEAKSEGQEALLVLDQHGKLSGYKGRADLLLGHADEEIGKVYKEWGIRYEELEICIQRAQKTGGSVFIENYSVTNMNKQVVTCCVNIFPILADDTTIENMYVCFDNMTVKADPVFLSYQLKPLSRSQMQHKGDQKRNAIIMCIKLSVTGNVKMLMAVAHITSLIRTYGGVVRCGANNLEIIYGVWYDKSSSKGRDSDEKSIAELAVDAAIRISASMETLVSQIEGNNTRRSSKLLMRINKATTTTPGANSMADKQSSSILTKLRRLSNMNTISSANAVSAVIAITSAVVFMQNDALEPYFDIPTMYEVRAKWFVKKAAFFGINICTDLDVKRRNSQNIVFRIVEQSLSSEYSTMKKQKTVAPSSEVLLYYEEQFYQILGIMNTDLKESKLYKLLPKYEEAYQAYRNKEFAESKRLFGLVYAQTDDSVSNILIMRCGIILKYVEQQSRIASPSWRGIWSDDHEKDIVDAFFTLSPAPIKGFTVTKNSPVTRNSPVTSPTVERKKISRRGSFDVKRKGSISENKQSGGERKGSISENKQSGGDQPDDRELMRLATLSHEKRLNTVAMLDISVKSPRQLAPSSESTKSPTTRAPHRMATESTSGGRRSSVTVRSASPSVVAPGTHSPPASPGQSKRSIGVLDGKTPPPSPPMSFAKGSILQRDLTKSNGIRATPSAPFVPEAHRFGLTKRRSSVSMFTFHAS